MKINEEIRNGVAGAPCWGVAFHRCRDVTVRNIKEISSRLNTDGIDLCNSSDVVVEDCFLRNNDDEICVKTTEPAPGPESKNILVRHCVIWNERARALGITSETRANISHVVFRDCDIIHDFGTAPDCSTLAVMLSDSGTVSDISFENIRCEDVHSTWLNCWIGSDRWSHDTTRGHIKGVTLSNISVSGDIFPLSKLRGYDETHLVEDVTFDNLRIQSLPILNAAQARIQTNAYVTNLRFENSESTISHP